ncbi:hypothetical protein [Nostoc commune]|uniref:hypothetical protein n=1 Tax=Nostoc commune TaxID=1178 RepID=UPI0020744F23|nr:hypothetical protein [Nostoc commune]
MSTIELVVAIALSVLALAFPVVAGVIVIGFLIVAIQRIWSFFFNKPSSQTTETVSPSKELG